MAHSLEEASVASGVTGGTAGGKGEIAKRTRILGTTQKKFIYVHQRSFRPEAAGKAVHT